MALFRKYLSEAHKEAGELQLRRGQLIKGIAVTQQAPAVTEITTEILSIDARLKELEPEMETFPCGRCGAMTHVSEHGEFTFHSGWISRGEDGGIPLDKHTKGRLDELHIFLCHACCIEEGMVSPEELGKHRLPRDWSGEVEHKLGATAREAEEERRAKEETINELANRTHRKTGETIASPDKSTGGEGEL